MREQIIDGRCTIARVHCPWCRAHPGEGFPVECPHGITAETAQAAADGRVNSIVRPPKDCGTCGTVVVVS